MSSDGSEMNLTLKSSKTDPFRESCIISYKAMNNPICPVMALRNYLVLRARINPSPVSPLFMLPDGAPLSRASFTCMLSTLCTCAGIASHGFTGHSFRIGAATAAARQNVPDHMIQTLGRWSSNCYQIYIRTSKASIFQAQQAMCYSD